MNRRTGLAALGCLVMGASAWLLAAAREPQAPQTAERTLVKKVVVPADAGWVDTGLDVLPGEEYFFKAAGEISLQRNNPSATCGPAGLDLVTVQQPVPNQNLGALIGKVAQLIGVRTDEDTGAEVRDEIAAYFFIGTENGLGMPAKGRLYLGVNEDVIKDNSGEFTVQIFRRQD